MKNFALYSIVIISHAFSLAAQPDTCSEQSKPKLCHFAFGTDQDSSTMRFFIVDHAGQPATQPGVTYYWSFNGGLDTGGEVLRHYDSMPVDSTGYYSLTMCAVVDVNLCSCCMTMRWAKIPGNRKDYTASGWNLYPNPGSGKIYISADGNSTVPLTVVVYTTSGQMLIQGKTRPDEPLDFGKLEAGFYYLRVETQGRVGILPFQVIY